MTNGIAGNYAVPAVANTDLSTVTKATGTKAAATAGAGSGSLSSSNVGNTFLSLLVKELQNQDPTAPMDSTAMVGQMISLNQLEQLTSINQTLSGSSSGSAAPQATAGVSSHSDVLAVDKPPAAGANQLPFDLNTMLPVGYGANNAAALAAAINPSLNTASMGVSGYSNNISGGK